jgi:hypothetical protein
MPSSYLDEVKKEALEKLEKMKPDKLELTWKFYVPFGVLVGTAVWNFKSNPELAVAAAIGAAGVGVAPKVI